MIRWNIPVGISDFAKIRENGYYYVDKSGLILQLLEAEPAEVTLITRPRRFGKTLGMSMLADFFDIRKSSSGHFEGLEIASCPEVCKKWMNRWPTIFFTLKDIDGSGFEEACAQLRIQIANLYKNHTELLDCDRIDPDDKKMFLRLKAGEGDPVEMSHSLSTLMRMMQISYKKPVILFLDEYDVPLAKANSRGYYEEMLSIIRSMMGTALKDNPSLRFAVITGCLKIARESIFTGTNNMVSDSITNARLSEYFGFTQSEVDRILEDGGAAAFSDCIKEWYDGYHFGKFDVYCPWDVMNYLRDLQYSPEAKPRSYWKNTSDNAIIRSFIDYAGASITKKLETLLSGGYILQQIDETLTYDYLHSSEENLWSILYLTGYLTCVKKEDLPEGEEVPEGISALQIPNREIREIFETTIMKWFSDSTRTWNRKPLFDAVWNRDSEALTREMTGLLRRTISYHDYREDFYHAFLAGIFAGAGYLVESNREHGEGRSDVVVYDAIHGRVAIFEAKYSRTVNDMEEACAQALSQIDARMYAAEYEDDYDQILCYGIAFFKKRCLVKLKTGREADE